VHEVRWDKGAALSAGDYSFFYWKGNENHQLGIWCFLHHRIVSAVRRVEFVSGRVSYIVLSSRWCNIIVLHVYALSESKCVDKKTVFYEELEQVFDHFSKDHIKILLVDLKANVWRENIFTPTIRMRFYIVIIMGLE
jgi:hypothetical protein